jgi:hypothetical protein
MGEKKKLVPLSAILQKFGEQMDLIQEIGPRNALGTYYGSFTMVCEILELCEVPGDFRELFMNTLIDAKSYLVQHKGLEVFAEKVESVLQQLA